ncbi:MAG: chemotaxis signal transduction protein [Gammaproteobacteria bacterium]|jgi:chemotaxis signal transduction protein
MVERSTSNLLENQDALSLYLDDLLQEATEVTATEIQGQPVEEAFSRLILETLSDVVDIPQQDTVASEPVQNRDTTEEQEIVDKDPELSISFPAQFLMFTVGAFKFSVPLIELSSVLETNAEMTQLPGAGDWIEGVLSHRGQNVKIVDSRILFKLNDENLNSEQNQRRYLVLAAGDVALSCDSVETINSIDRDGIHWRKAGQNQFFSGTIRESLASVLDTDSIVSFLNRLNAVGIPQH